MNHTYFHYHNCSVLKEIGCSIPYGNLCGQCIPYIYIHSLTNCYKLTIKWNFRMVITSSIKEEHILSQIPSVLDIYIYVYHQFYLAKLWDAAWKQRSKTHWISNEHKLIMNEPMYQIDNLNSRSRDSSMWLRGRWLDWPSVIQGCLLVRLSFIWHFFINPSTRCSSDTMQNNLSTSFTCHFDI